jgi:hypothetical protein
MAGRRVRLLNNMISDMKTRTKICLESGLTGVILMFLSFGCSCMQEGSDQAEITIDDGFDRGTKVFTFSQDFTQDVAWVEYAHPYPLKRGRELVSDLKDKALDIEVIGQSRLGNEIHLLTIPENAKYTIIKKSCWSWPCIISP